MPPDSFPGKIQFHFLSTGYAVRNRLALKKFLANLFKSEGRKLAGLQYIFCDDQYLLEINRSFLGHDFYTDIISFDLSEEGSPAEGEIYISLERVRDNAARFRVSLKQEIHRVIFHGALHLCGYKDKKPAEIHLMRQMEEKYLELYLGTH